jgi:predicted porin
MAAEAADLDLGSIKDPLPDNLTWKGITLYGTIDVGYAYQTNGTPLGSKISGLEFTPNSTTKNLTGRSISTIDHSNLGQSFVGVKVEEELGGGWRAIARLESGFVPLTGDITDGCKSFVENAGKAYARQDSTGDTNRCGQFFNGPAYAGLSNATYGTLTLGRQSSLQQSNVRDYDPFAFSNAFSLFGYSGTAGGSGTTQVGAWDNSVKYTYAVGPAHAAVMYATGGESTGGFSESYGANFGISYQGLSVDGVYTKEHSAVNLSSTANDLPGFPLAASISDNEAWSIMGKYQHTFDSGPKDDSLGAKLTLYGGYSHIDVSNPKSPVLGAGHTTNGEYLIGNGTSANGSPDNNAFTTTKVLQYIWTGAKYELPSGWNFTVGYYRQNQGKFVQDNVACPAAGGASGAQCAGHFDQGSFLVDYEFNKHFDVFAGTTYGRVADGLASGFQGTPAAKAGFGTKGTNTSVDTTDFISGVRLKF